MDRRPFVQRRQSLFPAVIAREGSAGPAQQGHADFFQAGDHVAAHAVKIVAGHQRRGADPKRRRSLEDDFQPGLKVRLRSLPVESPRLPVSSFQSKRPAAVLRLPRAVAEASGHRHRGIGFQLDADFVLRAGLNGDIALTDASAYSLCRDPDSLGLLAGIDFRSVQRERDRQLSDAVPVGGQALGRSFSTRLDAVRSFRAGGREAAIGEQLGVQALPHRIARVLEVGAEQQRRNHRAGPTDIENQRHRPPLNAVSPRRTLGRQKTGAEKRKTG